MPSTTLPEVNDYLLRFVDIEIIVVAPVHQIIYLFPVLCLVIVWDLTYNGGVISKLENWIEGNLATQSEVYKGLTTQPCAAPVLRMIVQEVLLPTLTDCGLWVRKSRMQLQREEPSTKSWRLEMSPVGIMVLKADL